MMKPMILIPMQDGDNMAGIIKINQGILNMRRKEYETARAQCRRQLAPNDRV